LYRNRPPPPRRSVDATSTPWEISSGRIEPLRVLLRPLSGWRENLRGKAQRKQFGGPNRSRSRVCATILTHGSGPLGLIDARDHKATSKCQRTRWIAAAKPRRSATPPASIAPTAQPRSRQKRGEPRLEARTLVAAWRECEKQSLHGVSCCHSARSLNSTKWRCGAGLRGEGSVTRESDEKD